MFKLDPDSEMSADPEREAELHIKAWEGLKDADLASVATLLRSDFDIEPTLRSAIADAVDGIGKACRIEAKRMNRGKPLPDEGALLWRALRIEAFLRRSAKRPGESEAAVTEAMERFDLARSTVLKAKKTAVELRAEMQEKDRMALDRSFAQFDVN